jgi:hypothetical protein
MSCMNCSCASCSRYRYHRNPDDYSPGNFRRPTLGKTKEYLDWWSDQGVTGISGLREIDLAPQEHALERVRFTEARHYWDKHDKHQRLYDTDHSLYKKPIFSLPAEDAEDYGDYDAVSPEAAQRYLHQFFTRQCERLDEGLEMHDVEAYPFKPRYDEAVILLGQDEVDEIERKIFDLHGYVTY